MLARLGFLAQRAQTPETPRDEPTGQLKTAAPFARSGCFKAANDFLEEISRGPVDWDL